jgi:serine/threonine-protein kinase
MSLPEKISRYKVIHELGRGGMATVYHAIDPRSSREVAIKVLPREFSHDLTFRARFEREIKALAGLEHPNIVTVYDMGDEDGQPYFVMRYMKGGSLTERIRQKGKLSLQETAVIIEKIAKALAYAHKKGFIHRDLKPDNILFDGDDNPYISDFGIAKLTHSTGHLTGSKSIGSPMYMSPEQARGEKLTERSDVYSMGVIVYQMLSGQLPYSADTGIGVAVKHVTDPVPEILKAMPTLPVEVDGLIKACMAKDPAQRFSTPVDLAKALNRAAFGAEGNFPDTKPFSTSFGRAGLIAAGVILLVLVIGFFLLRNQLLTVEPDATPTSAPPTLTATTVPTKIPTQTSAPTAAATEESALPTSTVLVFAPSCPADVIIPTPAIRDIDKFCVEKVPYTTLYIPEGASFEPMNRDFICKIESTRNGRSAISCTGISSFAFDLKVCQPPLAAEADLNKCPQDATFDSANQCCIAKALDAGCRLYKVEVRSCP